MSRIKFWPNKENRTVIVEIDEGRMHFEIDLDLEQADDAIEDFKSAVTIVKEDWIN